MPTAMAIQPILGPGKKRQRPPIGMVLVYRVNFYVTYILLPSPDFSLVHSLYENESSSLRVSLSLVEFRS